MTVRITEAELVRDIHAVLEIVQQGSEVIIEREDHRPAAVISLPRRSGRPVLDILRDARRRNSPMTLEENFGDDLARIVASHQQPWNPPSGVSSLRWARSERGAGLLFRAILASNALASMGRGKEP